MKGAHAHAPWQTLGALSMVVGRAKTARLAADLLGVGADDRIIDVGCGPGTAVREACRRGATATGVDPSAVALRMARMITRTAGVRAATFALGAAESLPCPDASATAVWALHSVHHWDDRATGLAEARRVLAGGGRLLLVERAGRGGGVRGAHRVSPGELQDLVDAVEKAGFVDVRSELRGAGRGKLAVVTAGTVARR